MAVFRIEKNKNYTVMANYHLRDISLSLKAKGLLSLMLSLPEGWDYTTKGLACICKDGVDSICSTVKELEKAGYVQRRRLRNELGHLTEIEYTILEKPVRTASSEESSLPDSSAKAGTPPKREKPVLDYPVLDNPEQASPEQEEPEQEKPAQLNIQESITEKSITDLSSKDSFFPSTGAITVNRQTPLTDGRTERGKIREQIEYEIMRDRYGREQIDELVEIMLEVSMNRSPTIRIGREAEYATAYVQDRFSRITSMHIERVCDGIRDNHTQVRNTNVFYNAGAASVTNFTSNYNTLVSYIQSAKKIPSFTSSSSGSAPTITLTGEETSVYDSNGVLSNFSFTDGSGAEFYKSGSTLYITQTGTISSSTIFKATRYLPSAANSTYNVWYMSGSSYQTTVSLASASSGNLNAYFKLKAPDPGTISLTKTTEDGQNLSGWRFGVYTNSACTSLAAGPYSTNANGKISITGLTAGTYYVKELGHTDSTINAMYYCSSTNPQKVTVTSGGTTSVSFYNKLNTGSISMTKTTEDGKNLSGWQFGIYSNSACTTLVSGPHSTNTSGKISVTGLTPGTYYVKELGHSDSATNALYYCSSTNPQSVTVTAGATASVSFTNKLNTGSVKLVKDTNTGANLSGWQIGLYTDAACSNAVAGSPFTTGADGTVTVSGLQKGTYYAKEIPTDDPYWEFDTAVKSVTVAVGQIAEVTFTNTHYGRIEIRKTTNTGNQLGGWTFRVRDSEGNSYGDFTTDDNGYACTDNLPLGRYTVVELPTEDNYWLTELGFHDVTVKAGETTVDTWLNKEQGLVWFYKKTNTGQSVEGWHITVYLDEACTQKVGTLITNEEGRAGYYLDPGIYWAKETGDEHGRFEDEYWMVDETVQKFEIKPHEDVSITFTNVQYGRLKIAKTVESGGSVEGWQFKVTDAEGKVLDGSPFATDEDGIILTGNLLPGTYTVEELLPEDSLYECTSENPQTVTVKQGEVAEVSFVNALRTGTVKVEKIDITGSHLADATFRLEWSEEGALWYPVTYSNTVVRGSCSNPNVKDGSLTTGADGLLEWGGLYPGLQYRLTETKAPEGYQKLEKAAYEGELPGDDLVLTVHVTNTRTFTMPDTGVNTAMIFRILSMFSGTVCLVMLIYSKKRLV